MESVEQAYQLLANELLEFCGESSWEVAESCMSIFDQMTTTNYRRTVGGKIIENDGFPSMKNASAASRAALFLRDDLLRTTGHRIWGLTFTLHPNGKFNIEYDYNKPEGYEETDETIDISLTEFVDEFNKKQQ